MANNKEHITEKYVTGKGELVGFIALTKPSTTYDKTGAYQASILLPKDEGEALAQKIKDVRTQQFKTYGKGTKVAEITQCVPYTKVDEETGEEIPDTEGRYILKTKAKAFIKDGKVNFKPMLINAKKQAVKDVSVGEGTVARLGILLSGYSVAGKTGVSVKLDVVQIINLVEYSGSKPSLDAFDVEEGYDGVGEEFEPELTSDTAEEEDNSEEDFGY